MTASWGRRQEAAIPGKEKWYLFSKIREKDLDTGVRRYDCIDAACHDKSFRRKPESSAGK
ncbi:hypothetical protein JCM31598_29150 [Desulfonatronum parangueonense]